MRTARLQTVYASVATTRCHSGGPQVSKFELVFWGEGLVSEIQGINPSRPRPLSWTVRRLWKHFPNTLAKKCLDTCGGFNLFSYL